MSLQARRLRTAARRMLSHRPTLLVASPNQRSPYEVGTLRAKIQPYRRRSRTGDPEPTYGALAETPTHTAYLDAQDFQALAQAHQISANNFSLRHEGRIYRPLHPPLDTGGEGVLLEVGCVAAL